jgi:hypothetical protein
MSDYDLELFRRDLDPAARGVLRDDFSNYWKPNLHALSKLTHEKVLMPGTFDELPEENKFVVISLVRHVVDVLNRRYVRKEPGDFLDMSELEVGHPFRKPPQDLPDAEWVDARFTLYLSTEGLWEELLRLASTPGAGGAQFASDPAVRAASGALREFLEDGEKSGDIVAAHYLEQRLEHGRDYYEDFARSARRHPVLDMGDLNSDDMHAFLCAYATCFRPREISSRTNF